MKNIIVKNLKLLFVFMSILFAVPSIIYIIQNKTVFDFNGNLEYCFLLTNNVDRLTQTAVYYIIVALMVIIYYLIINNRNILFKSMKQIYIFIIIISTIFILVVPFWCSDVFYYLGIGRLTSKYHQNPYYENIQDYVDNNNIDMGNDTVIRKRL